MFDLVLTMDLFVALSTCHRLLAAPLYLVAGGIGVRW